jgi:ATP-dependent Lon protease
LNKVSEKLRHRIEILELTQKIGSEAKESMDRSQREYLLREQLKAIQKELGESEGKPGELDELKKKISAAKMPLQAEQEALKSVGRLERMAEAAPEYSMVRTHWIGCGLARRLPLESIDLVKARAVLDADHHDLDKLRSAFWVSRGVKLNQGKPDPVLRRPRCRQNR